MSVAENPVTEQVSRNAQQQFAIGSGIGAFAILAGLALVFAALPHYWSEAWNALWANSPDMKKNLFLSDALLILLELAVIGGLVFGAYRLLQQQTQPGVRAGAVIGAIFVFLCLWLAIWIGDELTAENGVVAASYDEARATDHLRGDEVVLRVDVGIADGTATVWTCDLTHGYIDINAGYRS